MLDNIQTTLAITPSWRDLITPGDIVSFRFPLAEEGHSGRLKARPCLVLDIEEHSDKRYALLAYGTTSRRRSNIGYEVHVRRRADYLSAGLNKPTRFVGARRLLVSLNHSGFSVCRATGSAVLGRIGGAAFAAMSTVRGRIHAERDIAADRRAGRHSRLDLGRGRGFIVEWHSPHRVAVSGKAVQQ